MEFENLKEYYNYLERDNNFSSLDLNTYKYITALRDKTEDEQAKKLCSYELFIADLNIEKNAILPKYQIGAKAYPTLALFDDEFEYIKKRATDVVNSKYKAKYNHLIWLSPQKNIVFAKGAIDSYLLLLKNSSFASDDNLLNRSFADYFNNLYVLSQSINYKKEVVLDFFLTILETDRINAYTKGSLMKFIIENGKRLEKKIVHRFYEYSNSKIDNIDSRILEHYLDLLVKLSQKLNLSPNVYHEKLGDYQISQIHEQKKQNSFIAHHFYALALEEYKKANNNLKIEETAVLLEDAKQTIDLKKVSVELKDEEVNGILSKWWEYIEAKTSYVAKNGESNDLYGYLILEKILPGADQLGKDIDTPFLDLVTTVKFDINKNISKEKSSGVNKYLLQINNFSIHHIWLLFSKGIKNGKISYHSMIDFLKSETWYGQDFTYLDSHNEVEGFDWIELLSPALQSFFIQTEIDIKTNKHNSQGYILCIDSIVLKFEGLLREFSRMIGAQTIETKENGTQERISFDKLLDNDKLKNSLPDEDITYFKFLFTSSGMNLRNNVAHSFFRTKNYSSGTMLLLIVALLRLGNYTLDTTTT